MANCKTSHLFAAGTAALLVIIAGCGERDWGYLSGTVKLNGQPVGPGTVIIEPLDAQGAGGRASFGQDGKYSVISAGRKEGVPIGEFRVLIYGGEDFGSEQAGPPPKSNIPARYSDPKASDLKVTIESGENEFDIELQP